MFSKADIVAHIEGLRNVRLSQLISGFQPQTKLPMNQADDLQYELDVAQRELHVQAGESHRLQIGYRLLCVFNRLKSNVTDIPLTLIGRK